MLVLGGAQAEYDACPESLAFQPFLDDATVALGGDSARRADRDDQPRACHVQLGPGRRRQRHGQLPAGERAGADVHHFAGPARAFRLRLSHLDTNDSSRSIFNAAVAGTATGSVRLTPSSPGSAVLGVALTALAPMAAAAPIASPSSRSSSASAACRVISSISAVPTVVPTSCPGDCDGDGTVAINELITGRQHRPRQHATRRLPRLRHRRRRRGRHQRADRGGQRRAERVSWRR